MFKYSIIKHSPEHKNSKGESAPWTIISESNGKVISSHPTKEEATKHLRDIEGHKESSILQINSEIYLVRHADYIEGGIGEDFDLNTIPKEELAKGLEVEKEHSPDLGIRKDIVQDHEYESVHDLTGKPNYYDFLEDMEQRMKEEGNN